MRCTCCWESTATPGNGACSLTGQPSACGTAREVGTFAHRLPADMVVDNPAHRARAEKHLGHLPAKTLNPEGRQRYHVSHPARVWKTARVKLPAGCRLPTPSSSSPNAQPRADPCGPREATTSSWSPMCIPTISGKVADLILPAAIHASRSGALYGNCRAPHTGNGASRSTRRARRAPTCGMMLEFAKRFKLQARCGARRRCRA
jgi:nitrate reductase NapA